MTTPSVKPVILSAPQAWGKTRQAPGLQREFNCSSVVDDWAPGQPLTPGALHLTNVPAAELQAYASQARLVVRGR